MIGQRLWRSISHAKWSGNQCSLSKSLKDSIGEHIIPTPFKLPLFNVPSSYSIIKFLYRLNATTITNSSHYTFKFIYEPRLVSILSYPVIVSFLPSRQHPGNFSYKHHIKQAISNTNKGNSFWICLSSLFKLLPSIGYSMIEV